MSDLKNFLRMEAIIARRGIDLFFLLLSVALMIVGYYIIGIIGIVTGSIMLSGMLTSFSFSSTDDSLEYFYTALSLDRRAIVQGKFIYAISTNFIILLATTIFALEASSTFYVSISIVSLFTIMFVYLSLTSITVSSTLLIIFSMGFKKARKYVFVFPWFLIMGIILVFLLVAGESGQITTVADEINALDFHVMFLGISVAVFVVILWVVVYPFYKLSLKKYLDRDL